MGKCYIDGCEHTDMAPHPRGDESYKCLGHEDCYFDCECCGATFVSTPLDVDRTEPTVDELRDGPPGFLGWPLCEDCADHDVGECQRDEDEDEDEDEDGESADAS